MVAFATARLGGIAAPSLARPMLQSANAAYLRGSTIEAAARLREALRRHLAYVCGRYALDGDGSPETLCERLRGSGVEPDGCLLGSLATCEAVLTLDNQTEQLGWAIEDAFLLIGEGQR